MSNEIILFHAGISQWLQFCNPVKIIQTSSVNDVLPAMQAVENSVNKHGYYAVGFMSYEASAGFDPTLAVKSRSEFPLLWFGLYRAPEIIQLTKNSQYNFYLNDWKPSVSREQYGENIAKIKQHIGRGDTYQVNYTMRLQTNFVGDPRHLFTHLNHAQEGDFGAFIDTDEFAICSASPELFFTLNDNHFTARPMKGTTKRGLTDKEDMANAEWLRESEKNRAENVMIVDMIRNDVGKVAEVGSVKVPALFTVERYPTLWTMTSTVTAETTTSITNLMQALYPCASITGAPKVRTMQIIDELEESPRKIYTGTIGFIAPQRQAQFNVAIRTVLVDKNAGIAEYGVGGGIVWDSEAESEYEECQIKAKVLTHQPTPKTDLRQMCQQ